MPPSPSAPLDTTSSGPASVQAVAEGLREVGYLPGESTALVAYLATKLGKPVLVEGPAGVGKTELAKSLATALQRALIRLQCYDGLELREALYEWNYAAQLLHMRAVEGQESADQIEREVYQDRYLIRRPLLQALQAPEPGAVLLIDEVDRADEPFEAFLLEYLGEYQVSIPEIGTIQARATPVTILTSNRTRELNDAVKRRCLYHWLDYPERERELAIVRARVPEAGEALSQQVANFVGRLRSQPFANAFQRAPGIAESVEWAKALVALDTLALDPEVVTDTAGILFKQREDVAALTRELATDLLKPEPQAA
jgi:MoxR-like ATPase